MLAIPRIIERMFDLVPLAEAAEHAALQVAAYDVEVASDDMLLAATPRLERARRAIEGALGASLGELDRRGTTDLRFGHRTASWFALEVGCPKGESSRRVINGRRMLSYLGHVHDALANGDVSWEHTRVLTDLTTPRNADVVAGLQREFLDLAEVLPFERWRNEVKGLVDLADGDGSFRPGPESSTLRMTTGFAGSVELAGTLTALDGAKLRQAIEAAADKLQLTYREEVRAGARDSVPTRAELLAQALAELVRSGVAAGSGRDRSGRGPVTELTLVAHAADPIGRHRPHQHETESSAGNCYRASESTNVSDLPESTVRTLCCDPVIRAVVVDSLGNPIDLGRATRIVPKGLRRALQVRDGGCVFPGCDAPSAWCDLHHVVHWADGGPTSVENLASLCRHHHGATHRTGWTMTADPDRQQRFVWTRPDGIRIASQRASDHHHDHAPPVRMDPLRL